MPRITIAAASALIGVGISTSVLSSTADIFEMPVHSHLRCVETEIDITWKAGRLQSLTFRTERAGTWSVGYDSTSIIQTVADGESVTLGPDLQPQNSTTLPE